MESLGISELRRVINPLWHHLNAGSAQADGELYQTSLMSALLDGIYEGAVSCGELLHHGDFGLGTFNALDGEMVGFGGEFYQLRSDGSATKVELDQKTPFAVVTFFRPEKELRINKPIAKKQLLNLIEEATEVNLFSAIKISGRFDTIKTRTVERQARPFQPFIDATAHEPVHLFSNVNGTLAGFRTPEYAQGLGVAGFHLHFLDYYKRSGGHALDYSSNDIVVQIATLNSFHIELPTAGDFLNAKLVGNSVSESIKVSEGGE